jgi:hypothetical protein
VSAHAPPESDDYINCDALSYNLKIRPAQQFTSAYLCSKITPIVVKPLLKTPNDPTRPDKTPNDPIPDFIELVIRGFFMQKTVKRAEDI